MRTQQAWLFLKASILLLAATFLLLNTYPNSTYIPPSVPAPEKVKTAYGMMHIDAMSTYSPSIRLRLQHASTGFQAAQAESQTVAYRSEERRVGKECRSRWA